MRLVVALLLLAGCDKLFLQKNAIAIDASEFDGPPLPGCAPEFANNRYYAIAMQMPWSEAESKCRALGHSFAHLAVVGDHAEAMAIDPMIGGDSWVGLTSMGEPPVPHWITKESVGIPWFTNEPDNSGMCGRLVIGGLGVADGPCTEKKRVICECDDFIVDKTRF